MYAVFMKSVYIIYTLYTHCIHIAYTMYIQCSIVVIQSQSNIFVNIVVTVVTHSQRYYSAMCVSNVINSVSTVQNIFSKWKWFSCFPKSQSEIEMDRWWFDLTLTFWRNENWNDLAKIFSCCVINMRTHSVHTLQSNILVNGMTKVNDVQAYVQAKVKVKSLQSKLCCLVVFFFLVIVVFFFTFLFTSHVYVIHLLAHLIL